jgi:hypothetical protein
VPRYASTVLSNALTDYVKDVASSAQTPALQRAMSIKNGKVLDEAILKAHNLK